MEKTKKCSVGKLLNCDKIDCCRKVAKKWGTIEDVRQLSENQKDLLLFRANLTIDSVTSVCPYHKKYFCIDNPFSMEEIEIVAIHSIYMGQAEKVILLLA